MTMVAREFDVHPARRFGMGLIEASGGVRDADVGACIVVTSRTGSATAGRG